MLPRVFGNCKGRKKNGLISGLRGVFIGCSTSCRTTNAGTLTGQEALNKRNVGGRGVTDLEAKHGVSLELHVVDRTVKDSVNAGAGILDAHALADAVLAASPAGVDLFKTRARLYQSSSAKIADVGRINSLWLPLK